MMRTNVLLLALLAGVRGASAQSATSRARAVATDSAAATRHLEAPRWRAAVGVSGATPLLEERGGGERISVPAAGWVAVEAAWNSAPRTDFALLARLTAGPVASSRAMAGGTSGVVQADAVAAVEQSLGSRAALRAGVGGASVHGPADLAPFRFDNRALHPLLETALLYRLRPAVALELGAQAMRYGAATVADPIERAGTVYRLQLGARYGP
jgi:hypothetical protein